MKFSKRTLAIGSVSLFLSFGFLLYKYSSGLSSWSNNLDRNESQDRAVVPAGNGNADASPRLNNSKDENVDMEVGAWIYPGDPACSAMDELSDGRRVDTVRPEYFSVEEGGKLILLTESDRGCNGFSPENVKFLKKYSKNQYVTISSAYAKNMQSFLNAALADSSTIGSLVDFSVTYDISGVELDFEDFGGWSSDDYAQYKKFVSILGQALHNKGKKLIIDGPAIANDEESRWFQWRYSDFVSLPVDLATVMAYDYQFDHGAGSPIAPLEWIAQVIHRISLEFPKDRLSVGVPSYAYEGSLGLNSFTLLTFNQIRLKSGFPSALRDSSSAEMSWRQEGRVFFYQDQESLDKKREAIADLGIHSISVWHLGGGNPWFSSH